MDKYSIDSHKLMYHPDRVSDWMNNKLIYPIYLDISPSGSCNHRCKFCCMDHMGYKPVFLNYSVYQKRVIEMAKLGVKSIMFAGEGEPLLNPHTPYMIVDTKNAGIDIALTTNAVLLNKNIVDKSLGSLSWIKVSCAAGTKETYAKIHRTSINDFDKMFSNLEYAIKVKRENNYKVAIGLQFLLLPDNEHEVELIIQKAKTTGLNYVIIKPYAQSTLGISKLYKEIKYDDYKYLSEVLEKYNDENFNVVFRMDSMNKWDEKYRGYDTCYSLPFAAYIDTSGNVWGCCVYVGNKNLYYGNIYKQTFEEIWNSNERQDVLNWVNNELDLSKCQINCRMDKINKYLWDLKNPIEHGNFI